jgi:Secretion system C-terminal sorting domain
MPLEMRKSYIELLLFVFQFCIPTLLISQLLFEGHQPSTNIPYNASPYTFNPNMRQSSGLNFASTATYSNYATDLFLNFNFDTSGKNIFLVFTTNGSNPSKSNGTVINGTFSNFLAPNRLWRCNLPAQVTGTMVKYIFYISDSNLAAAWGRIDGAGYRTNWNESDTNTFEYSNPLPVIWGRFNASVLNKKSQLNWTTSSELNNDYFEVQYSADGNTFDPIGKVQGAGNSGKTMRYEFIHDNPLKGSSYYRLKQVDWDGKFEYSPVISVYMEDEDIRIYPNPATEILNIAGIVDKPINVTITDFTGKEVFSTNDFVGPNLDVSTLIHGLYSICIFENHRTSCQNFLKN